METGERASCRRHKAVRIVAGDDDQPSSGFLASVTTEETGLGSAECPWLISTRPGQRINLTLHNFAAVTPSSSLSAAQSNSASAGGGGGAGSDAAGRRRPLEVCFEVAVVTEAGGERRPVSVCSDAAAAGDGSGRRPPASRNVESVIAVSRSHELRVEVVNRHMLHTIGAFLIQFKGRRRLSVGLDVSGATN